MDKSFLPHCSSLSPSTWIYSALFQPSSPLWALWVPENGEIRYLWIKIELNNFFCAFTVIFLHAKGGTENEENGSPPPHASPSPGPERASWALQCVCTCVQIGCKGPHFSGTSLWCYSLSMLPSAQMAWTKTHSQVPQLTSFSSSWVERKFCYHQISGRKDQMERNIWGMPLQDREPESQLPLCFYSAWPRAWHIHSC